MKFYADEKLISYMKKRGRAILSVEIAETNHSDIEITELYTRLLRESFAEYLIEKKKYRKFPLLMKGAGEEETGHFVLLPKYAMHLDEAVSFSLKKFWVFHKIEIEGIRL